MRTSLAIASVAWLSACCRAPQTALTADVTVAVHAASANTWEVLVSTSSEEPRRFALTDEAALLAALRAIAATLPHVDTRPPACAAQVIVRADSTTPFAPVSRAIGQLARASFFRIALEVPGQPPRDVTLPFDGSRRGLLPQLAWVEIGARSPAHLVLYRFSDDADWFDTKFVPEPEDDTRTTLPKSTLVEGIDALRDLLRVWRQKALEDRGLRIECTIDPRGASMQEVLDVVDAFRTVGFEQLGLVHPDTAGPSLFQPERR